MKVLIVTNNLYPEIGGPYNVISSTVEQILKNSKIKTRLLVNYNGKSKSNANIIETIKNFDVVHYLGGWDFFHIKVSIICFLFKKKLIITPMGIYEPWSLNQKKLKKKLALFFYQKKILNKCDAIHTTSHVESENLKKITNNSNIIKIAHGIEKNDNQGEKIFFQNKKKKALFFSRIHKKKGILDLVSTWKKINPIDWDLHIYGPDYDGYKKRIDEIKDNINSIYIHDAIFDEKKKIKIFQNCDLFILPSKSENFGYVILESLNCGLPVMTTTKTPWKEIEEQNAGWIINDSASDLENKLEKILLISKEELKEKSNNALKLSKKYLWKNLLDEYILLYKKVINND
jgi:glycosyltransferase involved in cell wall biosynthesis